MKGYEYDYESEESLTQPRQREEVSLSKREKEIKENTRWGLYNFLTKRFSSMPREPNKRLFPWSAAKATEPGRTQLAKETKPTDY